MTKKFADAARSGLSAAILATDTSLTLGAGGAVFPVANTGPAAITDDKDWFKVVLQDGAGIEIVYVRTHAAGSNVFDDLLRGQDGTVARDFGLDTVVRQGPTAGDADHWELGIQNLSSALSTKVDKVAGMSLSTNDFTTAEKDKLAGVAAGATANTGTVTSVDLAVPAGFVVAGTPVLDSGTITLDFVPGYSLPTTINQGNWDTAYSWGNHAAAGYLTATPVAAELTLGGVKLGSDTVQTVAMETPASAPARTYPTQFDASGKLVVNVPWTDTATSYLAGTGLSLTGNTFSVTYGTGTGTAAAGDDSRIVGAMQKASNLADITDAAAARTSLGLGSAATLDAVSGPTDATAGHALTVGYMGLGTTITPDKTLATTDQIGSGDPWALYPVGAPFPIHDNAPLPPTTDSTYRYIILTAGLTGAGGYNAGVLINESVSGSDPNVTATATVSLAGSPIDGYTADLLNTSRAFIRPGAAHGAIVASQNASHAHSGSTGYAGDHTHTVPIRYADGGGSSPGVPGVSSASSTTGTAGGHTHSVSIGSSGGSESAPRHVAYKYIMRIK
jgi:hypothetical protein